MRTFFACIMAILLLAPLVCISPILAASSSDTIIVEKDGIAPYEDNMGGQETVQENDEQSLKMAEAAYRSQQENHRFILGKFIITLTPVFLLMELIVLKLAGSCSAENIVNGTGLVLIIQATILVVLLSPTSEQLTAAIGVLGAIAGYLFGSTRKSTGHTKEPPGKDRGEATPPTAVNTP